MFFNFIRAVAMGTLTIVKVSFTLGIIFVRSRIKVIKDGSCTMDRNDRIDTIESNHVKFLRSIYYLITIPTFEHLFF